MPKMSDLPNATPMAGDELIPVVQNGITKKALSADFVGPQGATGATGATGAQGIPGSPNTHLGCSARPSGSANSVLNTTVKVINFATTTHDTSGIFSVGLPTRLTVPAGVSYVRLTAQVDIQSNATGQRIAWVRKNGADPGSNDWPYTSANAVGGSLQTVLNMVSPPLPVVPGDYFELVCYQNSGSRLIAGLTGSNITFFSMDVLQ